MNTPVDKETIASLRARIKELKQRIIGLQDRRAAFSWSDIENEEPPHTFFLSLVSGKMFASDSEWDGELPDNPALREHIVDFAKARFDREIEAHLATIQRLKNQIRFRKLGDGPAVYITPNDVIRAKATPVTSLINVTRGDRAICPWHDDTNPSLTIYKKSNTVWCFACSHGGDAIDLYMAVNKVKLFHEAVRAMIA